MKVLAHLHRVFVPPKQAATAVAFYEALLGQAASSRFSHPTAGLDLKVVGPRYWSSPARKRPWPPSAPPAPPSWWTHWRTSHGA